MSEDRWDLLVVKVEVGPVSVQAHRVPGGWRQSVRWHGEETRFGGPFPGSVDEIAVANVNVLETELVNGDPRDRT